MNGLPPVAEAAARVRPAESTNHPRVSVLIQVSGRPEPLAELYKELAEGVRRVCPEFEFVFVVEPQFTGLVGPLASLAARGEPIRVIRVGQTIGQTSLLRVGLLHCLGSIILTAPARRRIEPAVLGSLIEAVENGADLAIARRWPRRDSWINRVHARLFHAFAGRVVANSTVRLSDVTSGVNAMRRRLAEQVPLYGDFGRFLPLVALHDGFSVVEVNAPQYGNDQQARVHSPLVYLRSLFDLLSLYFLLRFTEKPLRFFGLLGVASALPGALILGVLFVQRLGGHPVADRPLLLLGTMLVVLGIQVIALGLIGEIIVHLHAPSRPFYRLREEQDGQAPPA